MEIIMNKVYKLVWSKVQNCYVVVSEIARSHTKAGGNGGVHTAGGYLLLVVLSNRNRKRCTG